MKNLITITAILLMSAGAFAQESPWMYYKGQGQKQLLKKEYSEALKSFSECIKENQIADECFVGRGKAHLGDINISAARRDFESALKINPKNKEAKEGLANNPSEDAPTITSEGLKNKKKLTAEDRKILDNVTKSQEEVYKSVPKTEKKKTDKEKDEKPETKKPADPKSEKLKNLIYV